VHFIWVGPREGKLAAKVGQINFLTAGTLFSNGDDNWCLV
jgi:hypothetical protein